MQVRARGAEPEDGQTEGAVWGAGAWPGRNGPMVYKANSAVTSQARDLTINNNCSSSHE